MTRSTPVQDTITVHVPFTIRKRGGRTQIVTPEGAPAPRAHIDNSLLKALSRAFRWKRMLENGDFATIGDFAAHEGIAPSYMTRVMRLTLLAPVTIAAIVEGRQDAAVTLAGLLEHFPGEWAGQCTMLGGKVVIPQFLTGCGRRTHVAIFSFWAGVMPPMPMFGRSLL